MTENEERTGIMNMFGALAGIFLGIFLLFFSFSIHYINEMSIDPKRVIQVEGKQTMFDKIIFGDVSRAAANYKQSFMKDVRNGHTITNWVFRFLAIFFMWFALTLIFLPIFTRYTRDAIAMYSLYTALGLSIAFIGGLHIYSFIINGGLSFIGDFFSSINKSIAGFFSGIANMLGLGGEKSEGSGGGGIPLWMYLFGGLLFLGLASFLYYIKQQEEHTEKRVGAFKVYDPDGENER